MNCVNCEIAGHASLTGSPAAALPSPAPVPTAILEHTYGAPFLPVASRDAIEAEMRAAGPGAHGAVLFSDGSHGGHVIHVENRRGVVVFSDPQNGSLGTLANAAQIWLLHIPQ